MKKGEKGEDLYRIKAEAVEDLVNANKENTPSYSEEELKKYRSKSRLNINPVFKALFIKFWFSGVVCYFFIWGLGMYIPSNLDLYFVTAIGMGFVKDILENNLYRFVANPEGSNDRWMMFPKKSYMSLVFNVLYAILVTGCVYFTYQGINFVGTSGNNDRVVFGVEPIFFGIFYMGFELLFLWMKHMAVRIIADAKKKVEGGV
ncbi:MAG: hypothetical protein ACI4SI_09290 [Candidatus Ornithospirochaeta sp.]